MTEEISQNDAPDYSYWAKMDSWGIEEAILLLKGIDPNQAEVDGTDFQSRDWQFPKNGKIRDLIRRSVESGALKEPTAPADFIVWASAKEIAIPNALKREIEKSLMTKGSKSYELILSENRAISEKVKEQEAQIFKLQTALEKKESTRQMNTLFVMLGAIARSAYKHLSQEQKIPTVKRIDDAITACGLSVDEETIRNNIKLADEVIQRKLEDKKIKVQFLT